MKIISHISFNTKLLNIGMVHTDICSEHGIFLWIKRNVGNQHTSQRIVWIGNIFNGWVMKNRSEEHTSELQSRENLVCRLLLEKKKKKIITHKINYAER